MPETKDLILCKAEPEDWKETWENVWSRPECARFMFWDVTAEEAAARDRMERTVRFQSTHDAWLIREKKSGKVIGFTGVFLEDDGAAAEQGVCLCPEYWRKGYGTQVLRALTEYAKNELGAARFLCRCRPENAASRRLIEKEGFRLMAEEQVNDHRDGTPCVLLRFEKEL